MFKKELSIINEINATYTKLEVFAMWAYICLTKQYLKMNYNLYSC